MFRSVMRICKYSYRHWYYKLQQAAESMKQSGQFVNKQLMENERISLWALYKQATEGDAKQSTMKDSDDNPRTSESREQLNYYEAWKKYEGMKKQEAEQKYVKMVNELLQRRNPGHKNTDV